MNKPILYRSVAGFVPGFIAMLFLQGCAGLHIHQPADLETAKSVKASFTKANLSDTVTKERARHATVLEHELKIIRKHTIARRDARLVYLTGEGEDARPWDFLDRELQERLLEFGIDSSKFESTLQQLVTRPDRLEDLRVSADRLHKDSINVVCEPGVGPVLGSPPNLSAEQQLLFDNFAKDCRESFGDTPDFGTGSELADLVSARNKLNLEIGRLKREHLQAQLDLAKARKKPPSDIEANARELEQAIKKLTDLPQTLSNSDEFKNATNAAEKLGLGSLIDDLKAEASIPGLEAEREKVLALLSAVIDAPADFPDDAAAPTNAAEVLSVLATMGKALERAGLAQPVTELQIREAQLRLDIAAARGRAAFFDGAIELLKQKRQAREQEFIFLGRVEQLRRQVVGEGGCLAKPLRKQGVSIVFSTNSDVDERCRERVFKLLVAYSNAWTFGRMPQEELDYRLIALHHEAALDSSEVAFQRWESLIGTPLNRLVDLHATGLRPEQITNIINAIGLGAIAIGVN